MKSRLTEPDSACHPRNRQAARCSRPLKSLSKGLARDRLLRVGRSFVHQGPHPERRWRQEPLNCQALSRPPREGGIFPLYPDAGVFVRHSRSGTDRFQTSLPCRLEPVSVDIRTGLCPRVEIPPGKGLARPETGRAFLARQADSGRQRPGHPASPAAKPRKVKDYSDCARKPELRRTAWWSLEDSNCVPGTQFHRTGVSPGGRVGTQVAFELIMMASHLPRAVDEPFAP
jgi:hypothetical protein